MLPGPVRPPASRRPRTGRRRADPLSSPVAEAGVDSRLRADSGAGWQRGLAARTPVRFTLLRSDALELLGHRRTAAPAGLAVAADDVGRLAPPKGAGADLCRPVLVGLQ